MATTAHGYRLWLLQCSDQHGLHEGYVIRQAPDGDVESMPCAEFQRQFGVGCYFPPKHERASPPAEDPHVKALQQLPSVDPVPLN